MPRLLRLAIAMLPLALGAAGAGAQERPPGGHDPGQRSMTPREVRSGRESLMQRRREPAPVPQQRAGYEPRVDPSPAPERDGRSMSDAVRRVQRSTGGQILGAEQVPFEGRNITRVKYMDERGRVRYMDDPGAAERGPPRRADNGER